MNYGFRLWMSIAGFTLAGLSAYAADTKECLKRSNDLLLKSEIKNTDTETLISYLSQLLEKRLISDRELALFLEALARKSVLNPISEEDASVDSVRFIHRQGLERLLKDGAFDYDRLEKWVRGAIQKSSTDRNDQTRVQSETEGTHQRMDFVAVRPGRFLMGGKGSGREVTLTHRFEATSTVVTQSQWVDLMGENPSNSANGEHTIQVMVHGQKVVMQPDHPVENVTWYSMLEYLNRLSVKRGLKPAYDLSGVVFEKGTRAENGTLKFESGELKINAPNQNIYEAQGYRLPTEAELEYLMRAGGALSGEYPDGDDPSTLGDYAWFHGNSRMTTHPVGALKPVLISNQPFYDLLGNVFQWTFDRYDILPREAATDPVKNEKPKLNDDYRVVRGGCFMNSDALTSTSSRAGSGSNWRSNNVGFRVFRSLLDTNPK